jgi:hypothetical protein
MTTEAEEKDLVVLRAAIQQEKLNTYDYLREIERASEQDLTMSGYRGKTNAEAMRAVYKNSLARIEKLTKAHVKKWPDE